MKLKQKGGITSKIIHVFLQDATSLTGAGLTGLTNSSSGLTAYYIREGAATTTIISLVLGAVGTWSSGGFKEVDATNMPGLYEIGLPNTSVAAGAASVTVYLKGATNLVPCLVEIELDALDYQDAIRAGLTALPNVVQGTAGSLPTGDASGRVALQPTGMDAISIADVASDTDARSTLPKMLRALFNRHFNKVTATASTMQVCNDANTAVQTLAVSDDGTTATKGKSAQRSAHSGRPEGAFPCLIPSVRPSCAFRPMA